MPLFKCDRAVPLRATSGAQLLMPVTQIETTPTLPKPRKVGEQAESKPLTYKVCL